MVSSSVFSLLTGSRFGPTVSTLQQTMGTPTRGFISATQLTAKARLPHFPFLCLSFGPASPGARSVNPLVKPRLKDVNAWCDIKGIPAQHRAAVGPYLLAQDAKIFFSERLGHRNVSELSSIDFCEVMKAGYASPKFNTAVRAQLHGLKQGDMIVQMLSRK